MLFLSKRKALHAILVIKSGSVCVCQEIKGKSVVHQISETSHSRRNAMIYKFLCEGDVCHQMPVYPTIISAKARPLCHPEVEKYIKGGVTITPSPCFHMGRMLYKGKSCAFKKKSGTKISTICLDSHLFYLPVTETSE